MVGALTTPTTARNRLGTPTNPVTAAGLRTTYTSGVPGANAVGLRGSMVRPQAQASVTQARGDVNDPLITYQNKLRERLQQGQQFTNSLVQTKPRVQTKTGLTERYAPRTAPVTSQGGPRLPANAVGGSRGYVAPKANNSRNGRLNPNELARTSVGGYFVPQAASAFERLNAAFKQQFGTNIAITDSYRSYDAQVRTKAAKGRMAAQPGTSIHGLGRAADLGGGINQRGTRQHNWMQENAPRFGWHNPQWAKTTKIEPWHWEYGG